jgi:GNAT superfamily N-acetyltransferase
VGISYQVNASLTAAELNALRADHWPGVGPVPWDAMMPHSLCWITAHDGDTLVGFVNVAWDGDIHAFILDTIVATAYRRQSIGAGLVRRAAEEARRRGIEWLHVDFEDDLEPFYRACGFEPTKAGLLHL